MVYLNIKLLLCNAPVRFELLLNYDALSPTRIKELVSVLIIRNR